ncbi:hypothetical protein NJ7G_1858 [Natrinema sp. J7-2]|nr:hypothetical protein NJ7G_1858 [Natrinema sp. J7-2]
MDSRSKLFVQPLLEIEAKRAAVSSSSRRRLKSAERKLVLLNRPTSRR